jgi:hypothetical protein
MSFVTGRPGWGMAQDGHWDDVYARSVTTEVDAVKPVATGDGCLDDHANGDLDRGDSG